MMDDEAVNTFPCFQDGDVSVSLSPSKRFQLHSQVLRQNSTFFEEQLSEPGAKLNAKARRDRAAAYRFELVSPPQHMTGYLEQREVSESGKVKSSSFALGIPFLNLFSVDESQLKYWEFLLGFFYGKQPGFDETNVGVLLQDCHGFMDVADVLGSAERVREVVDLALLRQDKEIWPGVAAKPQAWADLAMKIRSPTIYQEAVIHLVGNWRQVSQEQRDCMDPELRKTVQRIYNELEVAKEAIEMRVLGHYPDELIRNVADKPGRPSYSNDIYMWMAVCFFRQFWAQAISDNRTRLGPDGGYEFYRSIWCGGQAYLSREDFQNFHQYFPMSSKACNVLETHMARLKDSVKKFVEDLMVNRSRVPEGAVNWLTCAKIDKSDLPWVNGGVVANENNAGTGDLDESAAGDLDDLMSEDEVKLQALQTKSKGKADKMSTSSGRVEPLIACLSGTSTAAAALDAEDAGMLADDEDD